MVDLHTHSTASDGSLSPTELVRQADAAGLTAIALTDHDTVDGIAEFMAAPASDRLQRVAGVEISTAWYNHSIHILGLFVDAGYYPLRELLSRINVSRRQRARLMLKRLASCGYELSYEALCEIAADGAPGRAHLAQLLVQEDICQEPQEAFERFIGRGGPAYASLDLPAVSQVIQAIHGAGGVAIWAHPTGLSRQATKKVRKRCQRLRDHGLDGLEAYYSQYNEEQQRNMLKLAKQLDLVVSGGSDFHGQASPGIELGTGRGNLAVPDEVCDSLRNRHEIICQRNLRRSRS